MGIDLNTERLTMTQAARLLRVHVTTAWRWALRGARGRRLRTVLIGGRRWILKTDLVAFLNADGDQVVDDVVDERHAAVERHLCELKL
jgi:hypothetical protein